MPKFKIYSMVREHAYQEVEANTKEEAEDIALERYNNFLSEKINYDGDWHIISTEIKLEVYKDKGKIK